MGLVLLLLLQSRLQLLLHLQQLLLLLALHQQQLLALLLLLEQRIQLGLQQLGLLLQLQLPLQGGSLLVLDRLQPLVDAAPLLHGGFEISHLLLGQGQGGGCLLAALQRHRQGGAGLHLAGGGVERVHLLLDLLHHQPVGAGFQRALAALLLQLRHQSLLVVALLAAAEGVEAGIALAHPEVSPALRELRNAAAFHWSLIAQQPGQLVLGWRAAQSDATAIAELARTAGAGKAFAQAPGCGVGFKTDLHLR